MSEPDKPVDTRDLARRLGDMIITISAQNARPPNPLGKRWPYSQKTEYLIYDQQFQIYTLPEHGISFEKNQVLRETWYPEIGNKLHSLPRIHLEDVARATGYKTDFIAAEFFNWYFRTDDLNFPPGDLRFPIDIIFVMIANHVITGFDPPWIDMEFNQHLKKFIGTLNRDALAQSVEDTLLPILARALLKMFYSIYYPALLSGYEYAMISDAMKKASLEAKILENPEPPAPKQPQRRGPRQPLTLSAPAPEKFRRGRK